MSTANPASTQKSLSVIIPALNEEKNLPLIIKSLRQSPQAESLVKEIIVADGGSSDRTKTIAEQQGAVIIQSQKGRGSQMYHAAKQASAPWLLFLHADGVLQRDWEKEARTFIQNPKNACALAAFQFALQSPRKAARALEKIVRIRCLLWRLPYGDQGLLISQKFYKKLGGFPQWPIMEDVALVRRAPFARRKILKAKITSSDRRYQNGYLSSILKNQICLTLYFLGASPDTISKIYEKKT